MGKVEVSWRTVSLVFTLDLQIVLKGWSSIAHESTSLSGLSSPFGETVGIRLANGVELRHARLVLQHLILSSHFLELRTGGRICEEDEVLESLLCSGVT